MQETKHDTIVSVIIPCYNCERWIIKCLDSIKNQTFSQLEVVCIDDCSKDGTASVIEDYAQKSTLSVKLIKNETNKGPALSRNIASREAVGEFLVFCDADDFYDETFIEKMYTTAIRENSELVMCEYKKVFESGKQTEEVRYLKDVNEDATKEDLLVYSKSSLCLLLIKREVFISSEIPDLRNGEDIAYVPYLGLCANKISVVKEPLYNYLIRKGSASNTVSKNVYKSLASAFDFIERSFGDKYPTALELLGIRCVLYGVTLNAFKAKVCKKEVKGIVDEFTRKYPNWTSNKYLNTFSKFKRLYLKNIAKGRLGICKLFAKLHAILSL